jgi:hypothetical protein
MPVVLQPSTQLVMDKQVLFHTDPEGETKSGKFSEECLSSLQLFDQTLHGLGPLFIHQFHHKGGCIKGTKFCGFCDTSK